MLEKQEPFNSMLSFFHLCGLWRVETLSKRHKFTANIVYFLFKELPFALAILSLLQDETVDEYVKSFSLIFSSCMNAGYISSFWLQRQKIHEFFDDLDETFHTRPESLKHLNRELKEAKGIELRKFFALTIWVALGISSTFIAKYNPVPMWQPKSLKNHASFFYILWVYQSLHFIYLGYVALFMQDFFFTFLRVINAYVSYLSDELRAINFSCENAKEKLLKCVKIHQECRRLMSQFTSFAAIPMAIHLLVGVYILCTAAIIVSADRHKEESGNFIGYGITTTIQLLYPCLVAQRIESQSEEFMNNIAAADWTEADLGNKKFMRFFMQNLSTPVIKLNLFSIVDVNLNTFLSIINGTYSTYAVLNSLRQ